MKDRVISKLEKALNDYFDKSVSLTSKIDLEFRIDLYRDLLEGVLLPDEIVSLLIMYDLER